MSSMLVETVGRATLCWVLIAALVGDASVCAEEDSLEDLRRLPVLLEVGETTSKKSAKLPKASNNQAMKQLQNIVPKSIANATAIMDSRKVAATTKRNQLQHASVNFTTMSCPAGFEEVTEAGKIAYSKEEGGIALAITTMDCKCSNCSSCSLPGGMQNVAFHAQFRAKTIGNLNAAQRKQAIGMKKDAYNAYMLSRVAMASASTMTCASGQNSTFYIVGSQNAKLALNKMVADAAVGKPLVSAPSLGSSKTSKAVKEGNKVTKKSILRPWVKRRKWVQKRLDYKGRSADGAQNKAKLAKRRRPTLGESQWTAPEGYSNTFTETVVPGAIQRLEKLIQKAARSATKNNLIPNFENKTNLITFGYQKGRSSCVGGEDLTSMLAVASLAGCRPWVICMKVKVWHGASPGPNVVGWSALTSVSETNDNGSPTMLKQYIEDAKANILASLGEAEYKVREKTCKNFQLITGDHILRSAVADFRFEIAENQSAENPTSTWFSQNQGRRRKGNK